MPAGYQMIDSFLKIRALPQFQTRAIVVFLKKVKQAFISVLTKPGLTKREAEILLGMMKKGKTDADIARLACISICTVHKHRKNIYASLGAKNRTAAVTIAGEFFIDSLRLIFFK